MTKMAAVRAASFAVVIVASWIVPRAIAAEFALLHSFDLKTGDWDSCGGENGDDCYADDEFDQS